MIPAFCSHPWGQTAVIKHNKKANNMTRKPAVVIEACCETYPFCEHVNKWTEAEAKHHQATARQCLQHSYAHGAKRDPDNCSGCALRDTSDASGPNYAGWARIYVEARMPIPSIWKDAFERELHSENKLYAQALQKSINTFGEPDWI